MDIIGKVFGESPNKKPSDDYVSFSVEKSSTHSVFLFADSYNHNIKTGLKTSLTITKHSPCSGL